MLHLAVSVHRRSCKLLFNYEVIIYETWAVLCWGGGGGGGGGEKIKI